nr:MAG TPA: hypothetical protein [Caudoviricetes sp.]
MLDWLGSLIQIFRLLNKNEWSFFVHKKATRLWDLVAR